MMFSEVEQTGASSQFYDKFSACDFSMNEYNLKSLKSQMRGGISLTF
jgi:hypothetical protein